MTKNKYILKSIQNKDKLLLSFVLVLVAYSIKYGTVQVLKQIIKSQLEFVEGSYHYRMWQTNAHPYKVDFYFYNWTNAKDVRNASIKPRFVELGPYRFNMHINRTGIKIHQDNSTVTYSFTKRFIFVKEKHTRFLNDTIITLNPVANALAYQARHWPTFSKFAANFGLRATKSELSIRKTIKELLFEGYEDPLLTFVAKLPNFVTKSVGLPIQDKFGYFYKRNYTDLYFGPYNVHVKIDENYGELQTINGNTQTPYFPGVCGRVHGKLGEFVSPAFSDKRKDNVVIYVHDLNVFIPNYYLEERIIDGVTGSVYSPKDYIFDNGTKNKADSCFCNGECVPSGLLNSSATFMNAPVFMSLPHFLLADPYYKDNIELIKSNNRSEMPYIAVEQETGLLLEGALTTQLNLLLQPIKGLAMFSDVPRVFVPVFTMRQHIITKGAYLDVLILLQMMPIVINVLSFLVLCASFGVLLYFLKEQIILFYYKPVKLAK